VDVALFNPEKTSEGAEVFIEVKTPGKLEKDLIAGATQLHLYNAYHKSAISILTDGIKWRFYLPSAPWFHLDNGDRINDRHLSLKEKREG
jgi:hypothetical protein